MLVPVEETREGQEQGGAPSFVNNLIRESGAELFSLPPRFAIHFREIPSSSLSVGNF